MAQAPANTVWEYHVEDMQFTDYDHSYRGGLGRDVLAPLDDERVEARMNELGAKGWEAFAAFPSGVVCFKRPQAPLSPAST